MTLSSAGKIFRTRLEQYREAFFRGSLGLLEVHLIFAGMCQLARRWGRLPLHLAISVQLRSGFLFPVT